MAIMCRNRRRAAGFFVGQAELTFVGPCFALLEAGCNVLKAVKNHRLSLAAPKLGEEFGILEKSGSVSAPSAFDVLIAIVEYWKEILMIALFGAAMGWVVWFFTPSTHSAEIVLEARGELLETLSSSELLIARLQSGSDTAGPVDLDGIQLTTTAPTDSLRKLVITSEDAQKAADTALHAIAILVPLALPTPSLRAAKELERQALQADLHAMEAIYASLEDYIARPEEADGTRDIEGVARAMSVVRYDIEQLKKKIWPLDEELAPATQDTVVISAIPPVSARPSAASIIAGGAAVGGLLALITALSLAAARSAGRDPGSIAAWKRLKAAVLRRKLFR